MVVDAHAHIFPPLAGACGFASEAEHDRYLQLYIATHGEPVRRLRDHAVAPEAADALFDGRLEGVEGLKEANFLVGRYGRFEWDWNGETYYRSFLPPSLQEIVCPPEFMLQSMARAGVDVAILQNARLYGRLNEDFAVAIRRFPGKFIGLADVIEAEAESEAERARLTHAVRDLGLRGVYYANRGLIACHYSHGFDDPRFDPYWETVRTLGIPVFWELQGVPMPTVAAYLAEIERLNRWCDRYPDISCVLTHGIAPDHLTGNAPDPVARLLAREQMTVEILYPIHWGRQHEYPYAELRPVLQRLYDLAGPSRLAWGSDMPNVERNCTYRQSLDYLRHGLAGIATSRELDAILGENVLGVLSATSLPAA
ncbi:MAG: amidohydrolase family protein [Thermomicrobiales bacterium]